MKTVVLINRELDLYRIADEATMGLFAAKRQGWHGVTKVQVPLVNSLRKEGWVAYHKRASQIYSLNS